MKKRCFGLDIIRIVATLMIIGVHSMSKNGFYDMNITIKAGPFLFILTMLRWLLFACVPIFIIITGYLKKNKKPDKNHYKSIIKIIIDYLIICGIFIAYHQFYLNIDMFNLETLVNILNFNLIPYAWYLQLYVGLFLIIPFLNIMYNNIPTKKLKRMLIIILVVMCGFDSTINPLFKMIFEVDYNLILKTDFPIAYPLSLYFLGAYIREYQPKIPKIKNIIYILITLIIQTILTYCYCQGDPFSWSITGGYGNIFTFIVAGLVFCLFYNINIKKTSVITDKIIPYLSDCSFSVYLVSYLVDLHFYKYITYLHMPWYKTILLFPLSVILHYMVCVIIVSIVNLFKNIIKQFFNIFAGLKEDKND